MSETLFSPETNDIKQAEKMISLKDEELEELAQNKAVSDEVTNR